MAIETFDYPDGTLVSVIPDAVLLRGNGVITNNRVVLTENNMRLGLARGRTGSVTVSIFPQNTSFGNAGVSVRSSDVDDNNNIGCLFRVGDGNMRIVTRINGTNVIREEYTIPDYVEPDYEQGARVEMTVTVDDSDLITLYINGEEMISWTDTSGLTGDLFCIRADTELYHLDDFRYTESIISPNPILTQDGKALLATKLGELLPIHSQIVAAGATEEFWPYPVSTADFPNWPTSTYPWILYSSADHGSGLGGIYVRVWNSTLGAITNPAAWEEWQDVANRTEFDHITTKTCPIYADAEFQQTETPTVRVIDGVVKMFYHTQAVMVDGYPSGVQNTHLATSGNGIDFTRQKSSAITYNPALEQGTGHTGYMRFIDNPLSKWPYDYIANASHGGADAIYGSNDLENWEMIKILGQSVDGQVIDFAPVGWDGVDWSYRINSIEDLVREGEYWRMTFALRKYVTEGGQDEPIYPVELLIDDDFNVVSQPNKFTKLGGSAEFDGAEMKHFKQFSYNGVTYAMYKAFSIDDVSSTGLLQMEEVDYTWRLSRTLADKTNIQSHDTNDFSGLTASANTSLSLNGSNLVSFALPANGDDAYVTGAAVTLSGADITEMMMRRQGRAPAHDIGGMVGFVDDPTNVQNGVVMTWPTLADNTDYMQLIVYVGGVATTWDTRKLAGTIESGSEEYPTSRQNYGLRIDSNERYVYVMDGQSIILKQDLEALDLTAALQPALIFSNNDAAVGEIEFESVEVNTYSRDARALRPIANAGVDQTDVVVGQIVTLDGSASTAISPATISSFQWVQTGGESVTLSDATAVNPTFTAPNIDAEQTLTFSLTVIDSNGLLSDADLVNVDMIVTSTLTVALEGIPDGTYDTRVINVDGESMPFFGSKNWVNGSATFTLNDVQVGTNCEVFALTPNDLPAGAARGVTE